MSLKYEKKNVYENLTDKQRKEMYEYAKEYMKFIEKAKTERECVNICLSMLNKAGFEDINKKSKLKTGDKVYFVNKDKSLYIAVIGEEEIKKGLRIIGAHIDSPRLDLKPMPIYEANRSVLA